MSCLSLPEVSWGLKGQGASCTQTPVTVPASGSHGHSHSLHSCAPTLSQPWDSFLPGLTVPWLLLWMTQDSQGLLLYKLLVAISYSPTHVYVGLIQWHSHGCLLYPEPPHPWWKGSEMADLRAMWVRRGPACRSQLAISGAGIWAAARSPEGQCGFLKLVP